MTQPTTMREILILNANDVRTLLPMDACVDLMATTLATTSRGGAVIPLRSATWMPDRHGMIGLMPGYLAEPRSFGFKVVSIFPHNHGTGFDSHQGVVMLFDTQYGTPIAVIDASSITAIRTAAASGAATRVLARDDADDLAILGSGVQAATHLAAMAVVRKLRRVRVWSRTAANARKFADAHPEHRIEVCATAREAVTGASIVCTVTAAREPILEGAWLADGAHVNAAGNCFANARELDAACLARARLITDRRESLVNESGDFLLAVRDGAITHDHIAGELGDVLLGKLAGRRSASEITLYESLGIAVEDLASAHYIVEQARARNVGVRVPFA